VTYRSFKDFTHRRQVYALGTSNALTGTRPGEERQKRQQRAAQKLSWADN